VNNLLEITDIHHQVHNQFSIDIDQLFFQDGPVYALIGDSGAGKSTLLRILALLQPVREGTITVFGEKAQAQKHPVKLRRRLGYLSQDPYLFAGSVFENIALGLELRSQKADEIEARVNNLLHEFEFSAFAQTRIQEISKGQQKLVAFLRTLAPYPEILLLDEPAAHLDGLQYNRFLDYAKMLNNERGVTIILTTKSKDLIQRLVNISISIRYGKIVRIRTGEHQVQSGNGSGLRAS